MTRFRAVVGLTIDKDDSSTRVEPGESVPKLSTRQVNQLLQQGAIEAIPPKAAPPVDQSTQDEGDVK